MSELRDDLVRRVLATPWYAVPDDLVGGWAVVTADRARLSELDLAAGERVVADGFVAPELAAYVAALHDAHWRRT